MMGEFTEDRLTSIKQTFSSFVTCCSWSNKAPQKSKNELCKTVHPNYLPNMRRMLSICLCCPSLSICKRKTPKGAFYLQRNVLDKTYGGGEKNISVISEINWERNDSYPTWWICCNIFLSLEKASERRKWHRMIIRITHKYTNCHLYWLEPTMLSSWLKHTLTVTLDSFFLQQSDNYFLN